MGPPVRVYGVPLDLGILGLERLLVLGEEKRLVLLWCWMAATATSGGLKFALVGLCETKMPGETD